MPTGLYSLAALAEGPWNWFPTLNVHMASHKHPKCQETHHLFWFLRALGTYAVLTHAVHSYMENNK